jgi:hypothetical protein
VTTGLQLEVFCCVVLLSSTASTASPPSRYSSFPHTTGLLSHTCNFGALALNIFHTLHARLLA